MDSLQLSVSLEIASASENSLTQVTLPRAHNKNGLMWSVKIWPSYPNTDQLSRAVLVQELPAEPASQLGFALGALLLASFPSTGAGPRRAS